MVAMLSPPNRYKLSSMNHCRCKPLPPLPQPVNPAKPCNCPPRVYRNPPEVIVAPGENISVDESHDDAQVKYTVNAHIPEKEPVKVDPEIMYGDGINEPLGVYDYDGEKAGLVPDAPDSDTDKKFLRADGQWETITIPEQVQSDWAQSDDTAPDFIKNKVTNFRGATANDDGTSGLVPAPAIVDREKFLKGDGTWVLIEIPEQVQASWTEEDSAEPSFIRNKPELANVATTGSYEDLEDKPDIPAAQIQSDWEQNDDEAVDFIKNKPELATVATTGDYADLENKPDIPAAQIQSDWTQNNDESADFIKHKPGNFQGATANDNGTSGFVPAPTTADKDKFLCGNGQWSEVDNTRECTSLEMDGWLDAVDNEGNNNG